MRASAPSVPDRRALGAFYTPADIAETLSRWALRGNPGPVLDPSYGICRFLEAAVDILRIEGSAHPESEVHGIDIDADATSATTESLIARGADRTQFVHQDFFAVAPDPRFAAVLGNPPYVRHHWQTPAVKAAVDQAMADANVDVSKLASLWAPFLVHAARFVRPTGRLAMLLPGSAVQARYATAIWGHLAARYDSVTLVRVGERAFPDALEETVVALLDGSNDCGGRMPLTVEIQSFAALSEVLADPSSIAELRKRGQRPERARTNLTTRRLLSIARGHEAATVLGEVATVRLGTVTGANGFFVRAANDPLVRDLSPDAAVRVVPSARLLKGAVWGAADDRAMVRDDHRSLLLNLPADGVPSPQFDAAVADAKAEQIHKRSHCRRRDPWWTLPLPSPPDAFLAYMSAEARGIVHNASGAQCINGVHRITWTVARGKEYILSTWTSLWALSVEQIARHYAGGVLKLEPGVAPALTVIRYPDTAALRRLDMTCRKHGVQAARAFADELILHGVVGFTPRQIATLQEALSALKARRSPPIRSLPVSVGGGGR